MEKTVKLFKIITIVILIIAISLISFIGIFKNKLNFKENVIPDFKYGMELSGNREYRFVLDTNSQEKNVYVDSEGNYKGTVVEKTESSEESTSISLEDTLDDTQEDVVAEEEVDKVEYATEMRTIKSNEDNVLNRESYEATKAIIQKRLDSAQIPEYNIRLNTITGDLILEVPEGEYNETAYNLASQQGTFEIVDSDTGVILLDNSYIKSSTALYTADSSYQVYLQIEFNDEGAEILKDISKKYIQYVDDTDTEIEKDVELRLDGSALMKTYFGDELDNGMLQITMGNSTTDYNTFVENYKTAQEFASILDFGKLPNKLAIGSDNFVQSRITDKTICYAKVCYAILICIISVVLIIKYKLQGLLSAIASVGYIAVTMLIIRYTNVEIVLNSIYAILGFTVLNYVFVFNFLNRKKTDSPKHAFLEAMKNIHIAVIPLWVVAIIFTFMVNSTINSVGMILFWGLFMHCIYSFTITRNLYV